MESTSRTPFVSSTPERPTFAAEPAEPASPLVSFIPAPRAASSAARATPRSWHSLTRSARQSCQLVKNNIGLLLVASSQLFFSLMNIGVKKLNSLDPPVSAVQVRKDTSRGKPGVFVDLTTVNSRTNGMQCLPAERAMTTLWYSFTESGDYMAMLRCLYVCVATYTCFQLELHSAYPHSGIS